MFFGWKQCISFLLAELTLLTGQIHMVAADRFKGAFEQTALVADDLELLTTLPFALVDDKQSPQKTPGIDALVHGVRLEEEPVPPYKILVPEHDGIQEKRNDKAVIDYSHINDGYFMVQRIAETDHRYKVLVKVKNLTYNYNIDTGDWAAFPLSEGDNTYQVQVLENVSGTKYANVISVSFQAKIDDPFAPFLRPNLHVNYLNAPNTMEKGAELTSGCEGPLSKVDAVFGFITSTINYDYLLAATVETGYLPDLDRILKRKRGICYDYSSLMTAMLRSQNVPCKLVFGYVGKIYHAWISVWVEEEGWIDVIHFDGKTWQRMDPTFTAAGTRDETVKKYVGNGNNYAVKYCF